LGEPPREPFEADELVGVEARFDRLGSEVVGVVKVCRSPPMGPVLWVAVLAIGQVLGRDGLEPNVKEKVAGEAIEQGGETADSRNGDDSPCAGHPGGLTQRLEAVLAPRQVVPGAEPSSGTAS